MQDAGLAGHGGVAYGTSTEERTLLLLTSAQQNTNPLGTLMPPTQQLRIFINTEAKVTNVTRGLWRRAPAHARAHTDTPVFVPVCRQDGKPWERLPPCVRLETTGYSLLPSHDCFREPPWPLSSCPEIKAGVSVTAVSRQPVCILSGR